MNFGASLIEALESLASNKVRTGLTMLGIIIGVGAVIAMLAIGTGTEQAIVGEIEGIGTNLLIVATNYDEVTNPVPISIQDAKAISDPIYAPSVRGSGTRCSRPDRSDLCRKRKRCFSGGCDRGLLPGSNSGAD